jgi:hypothetical protein
MALSVRLPEPLKVEAEAYARGVGISLNALLAIALRDYLDARRPGAGTAVAPVVAAPPVPEPRVVPPAVAGLLKMAAPGAVRDVSIPRPANPRERCGCGSGKRWNQCHGAPLTAGKGVA